MLNVLQQMLKVLQQCKIAAASKTFLIQSYVNAVLILISKSTMCKNAAAILVLSSILSAEVFPMITERNNPLDSRARNASECHSSDKWLVLCSSSFTKPMLPYWSYKNDIPYIFIWIISICLGRHRVLTLMDYGSLIRSWVELPWREGASNDMHHCIWMRFEQRDI